MVTSITSSLSYGRMVRKELCPCPSFFPLPNTAGALLVSLEAVLFQDGRGVELLLGWRRVTYRSPAQPTHRLPPEVDMPSADFVGRAMVLADKVYPRAEDDRVRAVQDYLGNPTPRVVLYRKYRMSRFFKNGHKFI